MSSNPRSRAGDARRAPERPPGLALGSTSGQRRKTADGLLAQVDQTELREVAGDLTTRTRIPAAL